MKFPCSDTDMIIIIIAMLFQGGFDYKKAIVDTIITIIEENTEAKEAGTFTISFPSLSLFIY